MNRRRALAHLTVLAALAWVPRHAPADPGLRPLVDVDRSMVLGTITVRAFIDVPVDARAAWEVLTDYDRLAQFVPDMRESRLVSKPGQPHRVFQRGEKSWLILDAPFEVLMQMDETPPSHIVFHQLSGTLRDMYGEWRLLPLRGGVRITYYARMEPGLLSPRAPGDTVLIRADIERMLVAIGNEMLRRQAVRPRP
ncbi:MAG TPA: SRPBCC family protein [Thiobacillaceae bacterium]|nr:SRPBCC family protein [Thiobacillaceae bacterium]